MRRNRHSRPDLDLNTDWGLEDFRDLEPPILEDDIDRNCGVKIFELSDQEIDPDDSNRPPADLFERLPGEDNCLFDQISKTQVIVIPDERSDGVASKEHSNDIVQDTFNTGEDEVVSPRFSDVRCDVHVDEQYKNLLIRQIEERLMVGSTVLDLEQAYLIYCEYGRCKGFGVRKGEQRYFGKTEDLKWKEYVCSCSGVHEGPKSLGQVASYKKLLLRTGCRAKIRISRTIGQPWHVKIFETEHNHGLVPSDQTYMLRSSRNLSYAKQSVLEALTSAGIGVSGACAFMERECGGPQNLGFTRQDAYDHLKAKKRKTKLENGDATALLEYFSQKSNEDPFFFWKVQLDDDHRIMNFFFRDSRCSEDYRAFGDVVSVDTTHKTNCYNLICAPFVGINHHTLTVLFGIGFLSDETTSSFEWLFGAFLESMSGVQPKVMFTDQCRAMMNALDKCFPNTKHRLCQWHINRNAAGKFGSLNGNSTFKKLWHKCMNEVESEVEFDEVWTEMSGNKDLKCRDWFNSMYDLRHRWASVFTRGIFTAGLLATSRSEGTNRVLKQLHRCSSTLYEFVRNYEEIHSRWRRREREEDTLGIWNPGQFVSDNDLFSQAASVYTRNVYKWFEYEATKALSVIVSHDMVEMGDGNLEISVKPLRGGRNRKIIYNKDTHHAICSCRMLEAEGIFCRHIIKVYYFMNIFCIPDSQILKRWTKRAKTGFCDTVSGLEIRSTLPGMLFLNTVLRQLYDITSPAIDHDDACLHILKQLEILAREVLDILGLPQNKAKPKRKVISDLVSNDFNGVVVGDPKPILEKVFNHARTLRKSDFPLNTGSGNRKKFKKAPSPPLPFIPAQYISVPSSTAPSKFNDHPLHSLKLRDAT